MYDTGKVNEIINAGRILVARMAPERDRYDTLVLEALFTLRDALDEATSSGSHSDALQGGQEKSE